MDVRTENGKGKLLFRWEPKNNIVSIVCKNMVYEIQLLQNKEGGTYAIIEMHDKHVAKNSFN